MDDSELDNILDDALKDFENDETPSSSTVTPTSFTPTTPTQNAHDSSFKSFTQQQPSPVPMQNFQIFADRVTTGSKKETSQPTTSTSNTPQQTEKPAPKADDADIDLDKIYENMSDDERKLLNQFQQEMDKFFNTLDKQPTPSASSTTTSSPVPSNPAPTEQVDSDGVKQSIEETLKFLAQHSKEMKDADPSTVLGGDDDENVKKMMDMFSSMMGPNATGGDTAAPDDDKMFSFLNKLMESLMAPDVLRQPMEQLRSKYPEWLEKNKDTITKEEFARYQKQFDYACKICKVYESQKFPDSLPQLIELMKEMQACGQPPEQIISELNSTGAKPPQDCSIQ